MTGFQRCIKSNISQKGEVKQRLSEFSRRMGQRESMELSTREPQCLQVRKMKRSSGWRVKDTANGQHRKWETVTAEESDECISLRRSGQ